MKTNKELKKQDKDVLEFLMKNEKWDNIDSYLSIILESNDRKRYKGVLKIFKDRRECKMFKPFLDRLEHRVKEMKYYG